ncbi:hypothetical protein, partial [Pseudonocardia asaccharolytica]|uniref:hypothetical protein n=1 Tax=Pseudonocardia asaccharolytica TaxID=54010 RepID=UPI001C99CDBF
MRIPEGVCGSRLAESGGLIDDHEAQNSYATFIPGWLAAMQEGYIPIPFRYVWRALMMSATYVMSVITVLAHRGGAVDCSPGAVGPDYEARPDRVWGITRWRGGECRPPRA